MFKTFHDRLSTALSRATRTLDVNRRRFLSSGAGGLSAAMAVPLLATPALVVARPSVETPAMRAYRESEHVRRYYATARL